MKVRFKSKELEYYFVTPLEELKGKLPFQQNVIKQYKKKIQILITIDSINELIHFKSFNFEKLKGKRKNDYSIRLNNQYRLIFTVSSEKNEIIFNVVVINEISKHYEK
ncbi:MAG: type II toxin-antitoxin system RelE/ParE family toxin [Bacteroidota bacterium]